MMKSEIADETLLLRVDCRNQRKGLKRSINIIIVCLVRVLMVNTNIIIVIVVNNIRLCVEFSQL